MTFDLGEDFAEEYERKALSSNLGRLTTPLQMLGTGPAPNSGPVYGSGRQRRRRAPEPSAEQDDRSDDRDEEVD